MAIPFSNLGSVNEYVLDDYFEDLKGIFETGQFVQGPQVQKFEESFAKFVGNKFCVSTGSGSDAMLLALRSLGIGPNDEVICPAYGFATTAEAVVRAGATPVFVDVRPDSYTLDPDKTLASITQRTKAIIAIHLFGHAAEIDRIVTIARTYSVSVIEDCRHSTGARNGNRRIGTYGNMAVYSFHPEAPLGGAGDGGAVTTNDDERAQLMRKLRNHGRTPGTDTHELVGYYSLLDTVQAALLQQKIQDVDENNAEYIENAGLYNRLFLGSPVQTPQFHDDGSYIYSFYTVLVEQREELIAHLTESEIGHRIPFDCVVHAQPSLAYLGYQLGAFPIAEDIANRSLALPICSGLKKKDIEKVAQTMLDFYAARAN